MSTHRSSGLEYGKINVKGSYIVSRLDDFDKNRIICLDTETTETKETDEILQLSIIDGNGKTLFNNLIKPKNHTEWPRAEQVNRISPEMVKFKIGFTYYMKGIIDIIEAADLIVG